MKQIPRLPFLVATLAILAITWLDTRAIDQAGPWGGLAIHLYNLLSALAIYATLHKISWDSNHEDRQA